MAEQKKKTARKTEQEKDLEFQQEMDKRPVNCWWYMRLEAAYETAKLLGPKVERKMFREARAIKKAGRWNLLLAAELVLAQALWGKQACPPPRDPAAGAWDVQNDKSPEARWLDGRMKAALTFYGKDPEVRGIVLGNAAVTSGGGHGRRSSPSRR